MAELATLVLLNELMNSDDEKPTRGKTRDWVKRRRDKGYFTNIIKELRIGLDSERCFVWTSLILNTFWLKSLI